MKINTEESFYINDKLKDIISNIIYDVQNYNSIISKYIDTQKCTNKNCNEYKDTIFRQSFLIERTMKTLSDFNDINSNSFYLNMNFENIKNIVNESFDDVFDLFKSKRIKFTFNDNNNMENKYGILMDRTRMKNAVLNIFSFIYNMIKMNGSININYDLMNCEEDNYFLEINGIKDHENIENEYIDISITFQCESLPDEVKKKLFKTPLISYENFNFNNLYLYTSYHIIKKHHGNLWMESLENNKERINITFPVKNNL